MKGNNHMHMEISPSVGWFSSFREEILRVWSRTNLEGQCFAWTGADIRGTGRKRGSLGLLRAGEFLFSELRADNMRRSVLWEQ